MDGRNDELRGDVCEAKEKGLYLYDGGRMT